MVENRIIQNVLWLHFPTSVILLFSAMPPTLNLLVVIVLFSRHHPFKCTINKALAFLVKHTPSFQEAAQC